jgi:2-oxoglutarate ferredoxin oxidoreductase subunit alpha
LSTNHTRADLTLRLGAAAGDGIQSAGEIMMKTLSRSGAYVSTYNGNQSLIRGGHVWFHIHAGEMPVYSLGYGIDYLIALTQLAYDEHYSEVNSGGVVIYDSSQVKAHDFPNGVNSIDAPLVKTALKYDKRPIMKNTVALGLLGGLLGLKFEVIADTIGEQFAKKPDVQESNVAAAREGYTFAEQHAPETMRRIKFDYTVKRSIMHAGYAVALGAVNAGCRFYAAYPMSPASPIVHWMTANARELGIRVFLGEDEIGVVNATIGASFAGARAMCATSGGGFSLMQEAIGQAAMTETPLVVVDVMRAGPSTGLPTKTSQGDLNMVLGISHDDFPRAIIAPRSPEDAYYLAGRAFNLAERYQIPVIILLDFAIGDGGYATIDELDFNTLIDRGKLVREVTKDMTNGVWFKRYSLTEDGVSPRALPGTAGAMYVAKTDEHDEWGHDLSDVEAGLRTAIQMREKQHVKRMSKLKGVASEMRPPELYGPDKADLTLVSWGSSALPIREAIPVLKSSGFSVNSLEFFDIFPLSADARSMLRGASRLLNVEQNITAQFAKYLRRETGIEIKENLLKYNGEPIYPAEVVDAVKNALKHEEMKQLA